MIKNLWKSIALMLVIASLTSCGTTEKTRVNKLEGVKDESAMGALTSKAEKALDDIYNFAENQVSKGIPLDKITLDMLNQNLRDSSVISGQDAPKYYGGLPNMASVVTGKSLLASASGTDEVCLYMKISSVRGKLVATRGVARDSFCRAAEPITTITWAKDGATWPDPTLTKLPTLAEFKAYDARHPDENVIPVGYSDKSRNATAK